MATKLKYQVRPPKISRVVSLGLRGWLLSGEQAIDECRGGGEQKGSPRQPAAVGGDGGWFGEQPWKQSTEQQQEDHNGHGGPRGEGEASLV